MHRISYGTGWYTLIQQYVAVVISIGVRPCSIHQIYAFCTPSQSNLSLLLCIWAYCYAYGQDNTMYHIQGNERFSQGAVFRNTVQNRYQVGGRYPTTSSHFSAQQDMLPAKNMIATQARQNKRRHAFQRCPWEACNRKGKKTHVHSDGFRNNHMPNIEGTLS